MAVNKCNITKWALEQYNSVKWGISCSNNAARGIIENYIEYLDCPDVDHVVCEQDNCSNPSITTTCNCELLMLEYDRLSNIGGDDIVDIIFRLNSEGSQGCQLPFVSYLWSWDGTGFYSDANYQEPELKLRLKPGFDLDYLVFTVILQVVDSAGCTNTKVCVYAAGTVICDESYVECPNPHTLQIPLPYFI